MMPHDSAFLYDLLHGVALIVFYNKDITEIIAETAKIYVTNISYKFSRLFLKFAWQKLKYKI